MSDDLNTVVLIEDSTGPAAVEITGPQKETHPKFWTHPARAQVHIVDATKGLVEVTPRRKRVAIVGFADSSRGHAPFDDVEWEVWGLNQLYRMLPRFDRWFEIHRTDIYTADIVRDTDYVGWLQTSPVPVYMTHPSPDIAQAVQYPIQAVGQMIGMDPVALALWLANPTGPRAGKGPYFQSGIAYMIALAIYEGFEEIGLWGIDLVVGQEYDYQKCNAEFWLGVAVGRGIRVTIPETSALLKQTHVYGYEIEPPFWPFKLSDFRERLKQLRERRELVLTSLNQVDGAIHESEQVVLSISTGGDDAWAQSPLRREDFKARQEALHTKRNEFLTELNALDGAISESDGWLEMGTLIQRGTTVMPTWKQQAVDAAKASP